MKRLTIKQHPGGEEATPGLYFQWKKLSFHSLEEGERLPGSMADEYLAVPWVALLIAGPFLGLAYVVFLPFLGIAMVAWLLASKLGELVVTAARAFTRVLRPGWEPAMAFLSRSKSTDSVKPPADEWAEDVRKKLDESDD